MAAGLLAVAAATHAGAGAAQQPTAGTFDSRAVAVAYARSDLFARWLGDLRAETEKARELGDEARLQTLAGEGQAAQERLHRQSFSAAPVDDILAQIEDELPGIAREAGVDVLVSVWDLSYRNTSAELADVTDLLVRCFDPDDKTLEIIRELRQHTPVSLEGHEEP
jgi:hypothetical protein